MKFKLEQCLLGLSENPKFQQTLTPKGLLSDPEYYNEYAIFCTVLVTTDEFSIEVKIKGKLDNFTINHEDLLITLNDLKTTGKPAKFFMGNYVKEIGEDGESRQRWYNGSFQTYHYYRQMGLYLWLLQAALKQLHGYDYKLKANMLLVETIPNFKCAICPVNGKYITKGLNEFKSILLKIAEWKHQQSLVL
jgi:hypothetical protein